jgi:hypothetical protein
MLAKGVSCWWLKDVRRGSAAKAVKALQGGNEKSKGQNRYAIFPVMDAALVRRANGCRPYGAGARLLPRLRRGNPPAPASRGRAARLSRPAVGGAHNKATREAPARRLVESPITWKKLEHVDSAVHCRAFRFATCFTLEGRVNRAGS